MDWSITAIVVKANCSVATLFGEDGKITAELVSVCGLSAKVTFHSWGEPLKMTTVFDGTYAITP